MKLARVVSFDEVSPSRVAEAAEAESSLVVLFLEVA